MDKFIEFIELYVKLHLDTEEHIRSIAVVKKIPKGAVLSEEGRICRNLFFIVKGTVRTFFYHDGKDITHWIYPENSMVTSWYSYQTQSLSKDNLESTEPTEVVSLTYTQWQELFESYPELERFSRLVVEEQMALLDDFYKGYFLLSAKEKYHLLTNVYPDITLRANLGHIASMLGVSQETISRIRK